MSAVVGGARSRRAVIARPRGLRHVFRPRAIDETGPMTAVASYVLVAFAAFLCITPFLYVLSASMKESQLLFTYPPVWLQVPPYFGHFEFLLGSTQFPRWVLNTLIVASSVTAIKVVFDSMAGYAFAKMRFPFKNVLFAAVLMTLMIPFSAIFLPLYFTVSGLGLLNTYWALILPPLANPLGIFMMRQFIAGLPSDLENAARLDGASEFRIYRRIILPLVKPGLVVLAVLTFLVQYTSFLWPLVATSGEDMYMVTTGLATQRNVHIVNYGTYSAGAVMALVPITIFFLLLQRYFIAGSLAGALKQ